ncbi:HAMP domain-containing histidine kinase [Candidatus Woesearchaeota archaeon]|nr:HAMP domain-containing histidine kinase [Candidatus Woesearchaeota archaeon]
MNNPLEPEEKANISSLLGHDLDGVLSALLSCSELRVMGEKPSLQPDKENSYIDHVCEIVKSIQTLSKKDIVYLDKYDSQDIEKKINQLTNFFRHRHHLEIPYSIQMDKNIFSIDSLIYSALYNLVKNAAQFTKPDDRKISVNVSQFSGVIPIADYISHEMPLEGDFVKFNVNDNGQGFPKGMPKSDFLKLGVSTRGEESGFGLYYVSLVCKFLRSHLSIDSKPGNTNVAIYHPLSLT